MKCLFGVFVHHVGDADRGNYLQKIRRYALEESFESLVLDRLLCDIYNTCIGRRMKDSSAMMLAHVHKVPSDKLEIIDSCKKAYPWA